MSKAKLTIALALGMALPMFAAAIPAAAAEFVEIKRDHTSLYYQTSRTHGEVNCQVQEGTRLEVVRRDGAVIIVKPLEPVGNDLHGYCIPDREYYVWRNRVVSASSNLASGQQANAQQVFTGGRWGDEVPVFRQRRAYFDARKSMDRNGHYNGQANQVACKLKVGTNVEFKPYRDWGVGQVRSGNCRGWIDRAVIK